MAPLRRQVHNAPAHHPYAVAPHMTSRQETDRTRVHLRPQELTTFEEWRSTVATVGADIACSRMFTMDLPLTTADPRCYRASTRQIAGLTVAP